MVTADMSVLEDLLRRGFTPVLHGDCVRDKARGFGILGGDSIVEVSCPLCGADTCSPHSERPVSGVVLQCSLRSHSYQSSAS